MLKQLKLLLLVILTVYIALKITTLLTAEEFEVLDLTSNDNSYMSRVRRYFSDFHLLPKRPAGQLAIGTAGGWIVGYVSKNVGRTAATAIGGGFILLQIAHQSGYLKIDWAKVNRDVRRAQRIVDSEISLSREEVQTISDKVTRVIKANAAVTIGFVGGFFIGVAS